MSRQQVTIFDTTLRDGEQSPGCSMNLKEKVLMARKLQELGVDVIEAGFPIASDGDYAAVKAVAAECREVTVAALCRTAEMDVVRLQMHCPEPPVLAFTPLSQRPTFTSNINSRRVGVRCSK